jgi:protein-disulfide isomerase
VCERALFVIDPVGIVQWRYVSPLGINPGADGILSALASIEEREQLMRSQPREVPVLAVPLSPRRDHILGDLAAPVTLVEYADFECPYCQAAHPALQALMVERSEGLRFVFRHFPLTQVHAHAQSAAEASEAAGEQGRFWKMHDALFEAAGALEEANLLQCARHLRLDRKAFETGLLTGRYAGRVREDFLGGVYSGVNGTPTFFINGIRHDGLWDLRSLNAAIELAARRHLPAAPRHEGFEPGFPGI